VKHPLFLENESRRLELPMGLLLCFAMFNVWQMGFIYFMGPSLVIDGRTPLPISMDNVTVLIAAAYVLGIGYMLLFPQGVTWAARITALAALVSVIALYLPLPPGVIALLLYAQTFLCCFLISFETFFIVHLFSEDSAVRHLTAAYALALALIAVVQNELIPVSFSIFRLLTLGMVALLLVFFLRLPTGRAALPRYARRADGLPVPKRLFAGLFATAFVSALMMLAGPAAVSQIPHGVSLAYLTAAVFSLLLYILYRKGGFHPLRTIPVCMGLSAIGFLLLFLAGYIPWLGTLACILIGAGFMACQLLPLYGLTMMKGYPSRFIAPIIMTIALITVVIHSSLVELFRQAPAFLLLTYMAISVVLTMSYLQVAPYMIHTLQRIPAPENAPVPAPDPLLAQLTAREREVLELIGCGYSNRDIASLLVISEHTVNDYTKKIYRKLDVHSRHAAAQFINRQQKKVDTRT